MRSFPRRAFAADLGVSCGVVVGVYAQLAAEGTSRCVADGAARAPSAASACSVGRALCRSPTTASTCAPTCPTSLFPRSEWLAASRVALHRAANATPTASLSARLSSRCFAPFRPDARRRRRPPLVPVWRRFGASAALAWSCAGRALNASPSRIRASLAHGDAARRRCPRPCRSPSTARACASSGCPRDVGAVVVSRITSSRSASRSGAAAGRSWRGCGARRPARDRARLRRALPLRPPGRGAFRRRSRPITSRTSGCKRTPGADAASRLAGRLRDLVVPLAGQAA